MLARPQLGRVWKNAEPRRALLPERAVTLTTKARRYGDRAICLAHEPACHWANADYSQFVAELEAVDGVGSIRAREIREGLRRLQEHNLVDRYLQL